MLATEMEVRPARPRVLVVDDRAPDRLHVVAALAGRFDVFPLPTGDDPLRAARARRPELVLLALGRGSVDDTLRICRTLRTDVRPIAHVAVYARGRPPRTAEQVCGTWCADGYLAGPFEGPALLAFVDAVLRGERPVHLPEAAPSPLSRLVNRLRGAP
jgi:DNA-binding response OmpR family regulator